MIYNIDKKEIQSDKLCFGCKYYNEKTRLCSGIGKVCLEFDEKTQTIIDPITKLPLKIKIER